MFRILKQPPFPVSPYFNKGVYCQLINTLQTMEQRNSYSKTDKDATFMRLKDDHMKNGQLKPAYNIQCATNGDYVVDIEGFSNPTDMRTQPPFIDKLLNKYPSKIERVVADSG